MLLLQKLSYGHDLSTVQLKQLFKTVWVGVMGLHSQWVSFTYELIWLKLSDDSVVAPSYSAVLEHFIISIKMLFELKFS